MRLMTPSRLKDICRVIVSAMGTPPDIADVVADVLVNANRRGVDSHGCRLLADYLRRRDNGMLVPDARPEIIGRDSATTRIDGHWGFGHFAGRMAANLAIESARTYGVGVATVVHVSHIARLGEYAEMIARQNMLGLVVCHAGKSTTPYGGMQRVLGTNPMAMATPRANGRILSVDFATSAKSINKLMLARQKGELIEDGILLDKSGYPTMDPNAFFDGGVLRTTGTYKGYAISLFIEIVGGILIGAGCSSLVQRHTGNGSLFLALDIARWRRLDEYCAELEELLATIKATPLAPGASALLLPGELEDEAEEERRQKGIPIDSHTWKELREVAAKLGVPDEVFALG